MSGPWNKIIKKQIPNRYLISEDECKCHVLPFDEELAKTMTSDEVRKTYPRFFGLCASCGYKGISYASFAHYIYGDW
jgi:hypothetical protein